jgi:pyruvate dehydrogenase E1 component alpha subunit
VVGGSIGLAIGAAYALKESGGDAISVAFFGDGALEEGIAFESLNIAALYDLPVLFVCENNSGGAAGAAAGEYPSSEMRAKQLIDIPGSLGIRAKIIDGADVSAIQKIVSGVLAGLRARSGPVVLETRTQRWPGTRPLWPARLTGVTDLNMARDQSTIRGEYADWIRNDDPVLRLAQELAETENVSQAKILEIDQQVVERMNIAREFALESSLPDPATALTGIFSGQEH